MQRKILRLRYSEATELYNCIEDILRKQHEEMTRDREFWDSVEELDTIHHYVDILKYNDPDEKWTRADTDQLQVLGILMEKLGYYRRRRNYGDTMELLTDVYDALEIGLTWQKYKRCNDKPRRFTPQGPNGRVQINFRLLNGVHNPHAPIEMEMHADYVPEIPQINH